MEADTAHRFWLGKVNVTVALARGEIKAKGPVAKILKLVPLTKPVFPRYKAQLEAEGRAGPDRRLDGLPAPRHWAADRSRLREPSAALRYEPVGGLNPATAPPALCPGGTNRLTGQLADGFWGASLRRRRATRRAACSRKTVRAAGGPRQGAHARPGRGRADRSTSSRSSATPRTLVERRRRAQGRVRVDRVQPALPRHRAQRPRPGRAAGAVRPRLPRLGDADPQRGRLRRSPTASSTSMWRLRERSAAELREALENAGRALRAAALRDGGARHRTPTGRALARGAGAVPGRSRPAGRAPRASAGRR